MAATQESKFLPWSRWSTTGMGLFSRVLLHRLGDVAGPLLLVLQGAVCKVHPAAHEGVGQVGALQDGGGAEGLVHVDDGLGLGHRVDVERPLGVAVFHSRVQQRAQRELEAYSILLFLIIAGISRSAPARASVRLLTLRRLRPSRTVRIRGPSPSGAYRRRWSGTPAHEAWRGWRSAAGSTVSRPSGR